MKQLLVKLANQLVSCNQYDYFKYSDRNRGSNPLIICDQDSYLVIEVSSKSEATKNNIGSNSNIILQCLMYVEFLQSPAMM